LLFFARFIDGLLFRLTEVRAAVCFAKPYPRIFAAALQALGAALLPGPRLAELPRFLDPHCGEKS
jgi:hypothetical protein